MKEDLRITSKLLKAMHAAKVINSSFVFRRSRRRCGLDRHATHGVDVFSNLMHACILNYETCKVWLVAASGGKFWVKRLRQVATDESADRSAHCKKSMVGGQRS